MCVRGFFEKEKAQGKSILHDRVIDRTAAATGIEKTSIKKISKESPEEDKFPKRYRRSCTRINVDHFDTKAILREVHAAYERKEYHTLNSLLKTVCEKGVFRGGRSTLHEILLKIGFKYKVRADGKRYI